MLFSIISCLSLIQWVISDDSIEINLHTTGEEFFAELEKVNKQNMDKLDDTITLLFLNEKIALEFSDLETCKERLETYMDDKKTIIEALENESNTLILNQIQSGSDQPKSSPAESDQIFNGGIHRVTNLEIAMTTLGNLNVFFPILRNKEVHDIISDELDAIFKVLKKKKAIVVDRLETTLENFDIKQLFEECQKHLNGFEKELKIKENNPKFVIKDDKLKLSIDKLNLYARNDIKTLGEGDVSRKDDILAKYDELLQKVKTIEDNFKSSNSVKNSGKSVNLHINTEHNQLDNSGAIPIHASPVGDAGEENNIPELVTSAELKKLQNEMTEDVEMIIKEMEVCVAAILKQSYNFEELIESKTESRVVIKNPFKKIISMPVNHSDNRLSKITNDLLLKLLSSVSDYRDQIGLVRNSLHTCLGEMNYFDLIVNVLPLEKQLDQLQTYLKGDSWLSVYYRGRKLISEDELTALLQNANKQKKFATEIYNAKHKTNLDYKTNDIIQKLKEIKLSNDKKLKLYCKSYEPETDTLAKSRAKLEALERIMSDQLGFAYYAMRSVNIQILKNKMTAYIKSVKDLEKEEKVVQLDDLFTNAQALKLLHIDEIKQLLTKMLIAVYSKPDINEELFKESKKQLLVVLKDNDSLLKSPADPKNLTLPALAKLHFWIYFSSEKDTHNKQCTDVAAWLLILRRDAVIERNAKHNIIRWTRSQPS